MGAGSPANTGAAGATHRRKTFLNLKANALQLMSGIEDTLDEYICANAGEPGMNMLVSAVHHVQMTKALTELLLHRQATLS